MGIPFGPVVSTLCFQVSPPPAKISTGWSWDSRCWPLWVKNLWTLCPRLRPQQSWLQAVDIHSPRSCTHTACSAIQGCTYLAPEPWQCLHCNPKCHQWVFLLITIFSSVQWLSRVWLFATPWTAAHRASLSITNSRSLLQLMSVIPSNHLILCRPLLPASGSFPRSQFFQSGGQSIGASASALVLPVNIQDWFPLGWTGWISFTVQGTLKSLLQHHS